MTVKEAMDIISGALDLLFFEFDDNYADLNLKKISAAEEVLEKLVHEERNRPENYLAHCPECGEELVYDNFVHDTRYCDETVLFEAEGRCLHCQNTYTWKETFRLEKIEFDND